MIPDVKIDASVFDSIPELDYQEDEVAEDVDKSKQGETECHEVENELYD